VGAVLTLSLPVVKNQEGNSVGNFPLLPNRFLVFMVQNK
jgi:hypothetical protein